MGSSDVAIPPMHKACVYDKPGSCSIAIRDVETPEPGPGEVLVKLTHSGVCHSDYGIMMNSVRRCFPPQHGRAPPTRSRFQGRIRRGILTHTGYPNSGHIYRILPKKAKSVATRAWDS